MSVERLYRVHWRHQTPVGLLIRWQDVRGEVPVVRTEAIALLRRSVDRAVRIAPASPAGDAPTHVITGLAGLNSWDDDRVLPPFSPNAWSTRQAAAVERASTTLDMKARLLAATDAGLIDLQDAARLSAALDLALGTKHIN